MLVELLGAALLINHCNVGAHVASALLCMKCISNKNYAANDAP